MEGVTVYGHPSDCRVTFGRDLILCDKIPVTTIELPQRLFQNFLYISLPEKIIRKSHRPQNKTYIWGTMSMTKYNIYSFLFICLYCLHHNLSVYVVCWYWLKQLVVNSPDSRVGCIKGRKIKGLDVYDKVEICGI